MYSRESQKLIYWLISDFSNFWSGRAVGSTPTEYELYAAKKQLKKEYLKLFSCKLDSKPLHKYLKLLESKDNKTIDELQDSFIMAIQSFLMKQDDFSLALQLMSQNKANKFIEYLFSLALDNDIPLRREIATLYAEQQQRSYIFIMLLKRKCVICGECADLDHWDNVAQIGGYDYDNGRQLRYLPLCRKHHTEKHNIGRTSFKEKYNLEGIYFKNDEEIKKMKNIYKNHFKAFTGDEKQ